MPRRLRRRRPDDEERSLDYLEAMAGTLESIEESTTSIAESLERIRYQGLELKGK